MSAKPLVLVIDDDYEFREDIMPQFIRDCLAADCSTAKDVQSGLDLLMKHGAGSQSPASLVILDMHMPKSSGEALVVNDAGVQICLVVRQVVQQYRATGVPVIIYTAYPTFENCAAAIRAGAEAYVPKKHVQIEGGDTLPGGLDVLESVCKRLLKQDAADAKDSAVSGTPATITDTWLRQNSQWLLDTCGGKWVSFVSVESAQSVLGADLGRLPSRAGVVVLQGDSYEEVRSQVLSSAKFYRQFPPIVRVGSPNQL